MKIAALALCVTVLAGCGYFEDPATLAAMSDEELCEGWHLYAFEGGYDARQAALRKEIERRGVVGASDWTDIVHWQVRVGMTQCAAFAAWGTPSAINKSMTANGQSIQFVFENRPVFEHRSVYTDGHVVTAIQD